MNIPFTSKNFRRIPQCQLTVLKTSSDDTARSCGVDITPGQAIEPRSMMIYQELIKIINISYLEVSVTKPFGPLAGSAPSWNSSSSKNQEPISLTGSRC